MTLPSRTTAPSAWHLIVFFQPTGSSIPLWTSYEDDLMAMAHEERAVCACAGTGGAPHFERWLLFTAPSEAALEELATRATILAAVKERRLPRSARCVAIPALALRMPPEDVPYFLADPSAIHPTLEHFPQRIPAGDSTLRAG